MREHRMRQRVPLQEHGPTRSALSSAARQRTTHVHASTSTTCLSSRGLPHVPVAAFSFLKGRNGRRREGAGGDGVGSAKKPLGAAANKILPQPSGKRKGGNGSRGQPNGAGRSKLRAAGVFAGKGALAAKKGRLRQGGQPQARKAAW